MNLWKYLRFKKRRKKTLYKRTKKM